MIFCRSPSLASDSFSFSMRIGGHLVPRDHAAVESQHQVLDAVNLLPLQPALDLGNVVLFQCLRDEPFELGELFLGRLGILHLEADNRVGNPDQLHVAGQRLQHRLGAGVVAAGHHPEHFVERDHGRVDGPDHVLHKLHELDLARVPIDEHLVGAHLAQQVQELLSLGTVPESLDLPGRSARHRRHEVVLHQPHLHKLQLHQFRPGLAVGDRPDHLAAVQDAGIKGGIRGNKLQRRVELVNVGSHRCLTRKPSAKRQSGCRHQEPNYRETKVPRKHESLLKRPERPLTNDRSPAPEISHLPLVSGQWSVVSGHFFQRRHSSTLPHPWQAGWQEGDPGIWGFSGFGDSPQRRRDAEEKMVSASPLPLRWPGRRLNPLNP